MTTIQAQIYERLGLVDAPIIIDVRRDRELGELPRMIPGALRFDARDVHEWCRRLPRHRPAVLYGQSNGYDEALAGVVARNGIDVSWMDGGIESWIAGDLPTIKVRKELGVPGRSSWITRERPKIDRLACPWLLRRFIDPTAAFFYVPAQNVRAEAAILRAEPYDIPDVTFSHRGTSCSFDAFLEEFDLHDEPLQKLADIVRAADTDDLDRSREAPGLLAISLGLSATIPDDLLLLEQAMHVYDALYAWCKTSPKEIHAWPQPQRKEART